MAELRRLGIAEHVLVVVILAVAGGSRAWYVSACARNGATPGPLQVQDARGESLDELVLNLSRDQGYARTTNDPNTVRPVAHPAPLYPWLLSWLLRFSVGPEAMQSLVRWMQCGLGALTAMLLFLFGRQAFHSPLVGAVAGLLGAIYPFWIINTAEIDDGVLTTFLLALCVYLGATVGQAGGYLTSWFYGLSLAALSLTRAALLPFALVALLAFLRRCRVLERGWMLAILGFLGLVSGLAPWAVRNYHVYHDVYPVVDSAIFDLWVGNHASATGGPQPAVTTENPPLTDRERLEQILAEVRSNPSGTWSRRIWAGLDFLFGEDWFKTGKLWRGAESPEAELEMPDWLARSYPALLCGSLLGLLLFGFLGWRWTYPWRKEATPSALALLWVPLPYLLSHAEALQGPRLPLDGVLICYAAYALTWLAVSLRNPFRKGELGFEVESR